MRFYKTLFNHSCVFKKFRQRVGVYTHFSSTPTTVAFYGVILIFLISSYAYAYTNEEILNAVYKAEGGSKAQFAYGIRSVHYKDLAEARQIALRTIVNNRVRFKNQTKYKDYINFLASRYAPINSPNDPLGLNSNWIRNMRYFLKKGE